MISLLVRGIGALAALSLQLFSSLALAAEQSAQPLVTSTFSSMLQVLLGLGLVLAAISATAWLLKRLSPGQVGNASGLRVVAAVAVGPKERVVLVDVGESRLILGVAPGQVVCLKEMPRPADAADPEDTLLDDTFLSKLKAKLASHGANK